MGMVAPQQRIASTFVVLCGRHGEVSRYARQRGVCRQAVYRESARTLAGLEGTPQIVEIAIRALSPAVNDTFTGVACVDWAADAMLMAADVSLSDGCWYDRAGKMRLRVPPLRLERLVKLAFDQIRQAAADNPAVLIRILDIIRRITPRMPTEGARQALMAQADAVREAARAKVLVQLDRDDVEAAWRRARPASEASSVSA
jgi:uncharacterized membrane protein